MYRTGGVAGKVIVGIIVALLTIGALLCLAVLIYGSVKGLQFGEAFKTMFSFLNIETAEKTTETTKNVIETIKK